MFGKREKQLREEDAGTAFCNFFSLILSEKKNFKKSSAHLPVTGKLVYQRKTHVKVRIIHG